MNKLEKLKKQNLFIAIGSILVLFFAFIYANEKKSTPVKSKVTTNINYDTIKFTNGFDFPVGKPNAQGYYNAQKFTVNNHLGDDWNGTGGGNSDLGDPIYSIANGYVSFAENVHGGWGKVIRIVHYISKEKKVESLYAHCQNMYINKGDYVSKGQQIGTIGNNDGMYLAHLHFEIRDKLNLPIGPGYSDDTRGYLDPTVFINSHRN